MKLYSKHYFKVIFKFNLFQVNNVPLLYPLRTSGKLCFYVFFRGYQRRTQNHLKHPSRHRT